MVVVARKSHMLREANYMYQAVEKIATKYQLLLNRSLIKKHDRIRIDLVDYN
jgi:hypothetical protein